MPSFNNLGDFGIGDCELGDFDLTPNEQHEVPQKTVEVKCKQLSYEPIELTF